MPTAKRPRPAAADDTTTSAAPAPDTQATPGAGQAPASEVGSSPAGGVSSSPAASSPAGSSPDELRVMVPPVGDTPPPPLMEPEPGQDQDTGLYYVIGVGVCYAHHGNPVNVCLGLQGRVIALVDAEAERLLMQGAVRAANEQDIAAEALRVGREAVSDAEATLGPARNPYGGTIVGTTLERHAAEQIALAKTSAAISDQAAADALERITRARATGQQAPVI